MEPTARTSTPSPPPPLFCPFFDAHPAGTQKQVHLDTNYLCLPKDFLGLAPMSVLCDRISSVLNPGVESLDCPARPNSAAHGGVWTEETCRELRFLFREFISELLQVRFVLSSLRRWG